MMDGELLKNRISAAIPQAEIGVEVSGNHCQLKIVADDFVGLNSLKRQQKVYACLNDLISDGTVHAVNMNLYTLEEWEKAKKFLL